MAAPDSFALAYVGDLHTALLLLGPATTPIAFTANDAADLPDKPRMMHVSVAGNIKYTANGVTQGPIAYEVGWHPARFDRIWSTGLTATVELWK